MIRTDLVQPLYLGLYSTWWRYGQNTTVKQYNPNGVWCCNTHLKSDCACVIAVQAFDDVWGHDEDVFGQCSTMICSTNPTVRRYGTVLRVVREARTVVAIKT